MKQIYIDYAASTPVRCEVLLEMRRFERVFANPSSVHSAGVRVREVLEDARGNIAVIVSCDLIGLLPDEIKKIFNGVKTVGKDRIFLTTTHTHSGPDVIGIW